MLKQSQVVDEIVTNAVDWEMQAPLRARFRDLPTSLELDYSNQRLADQEEARKKRRKRRDVPRTPSGSPPSQPPPLPPLAGASSAPGSKAPSSSKTAASASQSMAWTSSDTRYELTGVSMAQELSPTDSLMQDDFILNEQVHLSDDEDSKIDHLPKADSRKDWWKPLPEEERPATPQPAWIILSSNVSYIENNWDSALVSTYEPPAENSLLAKTGDMTTFMNCSKWRSVTRCSQIRLFGRIQKENKSESMSTNLCLSVVLQVMLLFNHNSSSIRLGVFEIWQQGKKSRTIDFQDEGCYDFEELNLLLLQGHLDHLPSSDKRMLSTADARGYEFKLDYTIIESPRAVVFPVDNNDRKIMRFNKIYKFSDGTLTRILEALDYKVKEFKVKQLNPGMNMRFWTQKDVTRSKEFIAAIERRLKTRRIYRNLECFVGGHVRDIDYMLLQITE
ncbi:hypothetical protein Tco_0089928 [Tanacetum coccineum]